MRFLATKRAYRGGPTDQLLGIVSSMLCSHSRKPQLHPQLPDVGKGDFGVSIKKLHSFLTGGGSQPHIVSSMGPSPHQKKKKDKNKIDIRSKQLKIGLTDNLNFHKCIL